MVDLERQPLLHRILLRQNNLAPNWSSNKALSPFKNLPLVLGDFFRKTFDKRRPFYRMRGLRFRANVRA